MCKAILSLLSARLSLRKPKLWDWLRNCCWQPDAGVGAERRRHRQQRNTWVLAHAELEQFLALQDQVQGSLELEAGGLMLSSVRQMLRLLFLCL